MSCAATAAPTIGPATTATSPTLAPDSVPCVRGRASCSATSSCAAWCRSASRSTGRPSRSPPGCAASTPAHPGSMPPDDLPSPLRAGEVRALAQAHPASADGTFPAPTAPDSAGPHTPLPRSLAADRRTPARRGGSPTHRRLGRGSHRRQGRCERHWHACRSSLAPRAARSPA